MIEITTKNQGAELTSIKLNGEEKLHDGVTDWNRHAPVLFPIVGKLKNGETMIEGKVYKMGQHGFARDMEFEKIGDHSYRLKFNEKTLEKFPYQFEFKISYETTKNSVTTKYEIKNIDDKTMKFGLGGHPAFKCNYENCELEFEQPEEKIEFYQLENGLVKLEEEDKSKFINKNKITFNKTTFDNDAIIMKNLKSNKIILKENGKPILEFDFTDFPLLAIWSKPGANFLCLEPWFNTADKINSDGNFETKENLIKLRPNEVFKCSYTVKFYTKN